MAADGNLCIGPLNGSLRLQLSISGREQPCCFLPLVVVCVLYGLWFLWLGIPAYNLDPTLPRGSNWPLNNSPGAAACGHPASLLESPLYSLPIRLCWSWFFCLSKVIRLLCCYCSVVSSGWFLYNWVVIPDWFWEEVSVTSFTLLPSCRSPILMWLSKVRTSYFQNRCQWSKVWMKQFQVPD